MQRSRGRHLEQKQALERRKQKAAALGNRNKKDQQNGFLRTQISIGPFWLALPNPANPVIIFQGNILRTTLRGIAWSENSIPLASRTTGFAVDLYHALRSSHKEENIFYSPLGASMILGMVELGAKGKLKSQIRQMLKLQGNATEEDFFMLKSFFSVISEQNKEFTFHLANALYLQEGFSVKEQYLHSNKEIFQGAVKLVNFQDSKACTKAINTWIESKTDGKMKNMFSTEEFGPLTRLLLVNAIYFKGDWKQKFKIEATQLMGFTKRDGSTVKIPMMNLLLRTKFGHFSESNVSYQVLELPYKGDEFGLILILPEEGTDIEEVEKLITPELVKEWLTKIQEEEVEIRLPRFKIEQKLDFKEVFHSLKVTEMFSGGCDLSGITESGDLHVSKVAQKIFFEVNEDGSEVAASSGMQVPVIMSLARNQFVANHPFMFIMKNNPTESILFMGRMADPEVQKIKGRDTDSL
ncbi:serpin I2 [Tachyglossus aculeatus]|uniref:serpin I2 n=1 Tax=Tachyglossus aculeatus TaxID=9261 RepID=UPI0018F323D7|nr:serpin I2 [Tachyglossus aculeatus]